MKKVLAALTLMFLSGCASTYTMTYVNENGDRMTYHCSGDTVIYFNRTSGRISYWCN